MVPHKLATVVALLALATGYCQSTQLQNGPDTRKTTFTDLPTNGRRQSSGGGVLPFIPNFKKQAQPSNVIPQTGNTSNKIVSNGDNSSNILLNNQGELKQQSPIVLKEQPTVVVQPSYERDQPTSSYTVKPSPILNQAQPSILEPAVRTRLPHHHQTPLNQATYQYPLEPTVQVPQPQLRHQTVLSQPQLVRSVEPVVRELKDHRPVPQIDRAKNMNVFGPVQSGGSSFNVNNHVSNVKVGNTKKSDVNVVNQVITPTNIGTTHIEEPSYDEDSSLGVGRSPYGKPKRYVDGKKYTKVRYDADENPGLSANPNNLGPNNGYYGEEDDCVEHCDAETGHPMDELHYVGANNPQEPLYKHLGRKRYGKNGLLKTKPKKKATLEQKNLKKRLLDLASKATYDPVSNDDDVPLLKFNKDTGKYEAVQVDPSTKAYKNKLREALAALSAKKLPANKLRRVLGEDGYPADYPGNNYFYDDDSSDPESGGSLDDVPIETVRSERRRARVPNNNYPDYGASGAYLVTPRDDPRVDRADLIGQIRAILNDNLNRINDLLYFRPEFLSELLEVDESELTPIEHEFKRFILCNADERFCQQDLSLFQTNRRPIEENYNENLPYSSTEDDDNYQARHQNHQPQHYNDYEQDLINNNHGREYDSSLDSDLDSDDYSRYRAGNEDYHFRHSTEGARNGFPTRKQAREYSEQSSYQKTKNPSGFVPLSNPETKVRRNPGYGQSNNLVENGTSAPVAGNLGYLHGGSNPDQPYTVGVLKPRKERQQQRSLQNSSSPSSLLQAQAQAQAQARTLSEPKRKSRVQVSSVVDSKRF